jgi:hypothetical protein
MQKVLFMTNGEHRERRDAEATTVSEASQGPDLEVQSGARGSGETAENAATEAAEGDRVIAGIKRIGREVDRTFRGEYEAREDEAGAPRAEEGTGG